MTKNIYQRLLSVMEIVAKVKKGGMNKFHNYPYVRVEDAIEALRKPTIESGIFIQTSVVEYSHEIGKTTKTDGKGNTTESTSIFANVILEVSFINADNPDDRFVVRYPGTGIDTQDKGCGKAITSAYKTMLLKVFCIESSDDIEQDDIGFTRTQHQKAHNPQRTVQDTSRIDEYQLKHLLKIAPKERLDNYLIAKNLDTVRDISIHQYNSIVDQIRIESTGKKVA